MRSNRHRASGRSPVNGTGGRSSRRPSAPGGVSAVAGYRAVAVPAPAFAPGVLGAWLLEACARVDRFVLDHFIRRGPTTAPTGLRDRLRRASAFYAAPGFIADPDSFFAPPRAFASTARRITALPGGELLDVRYETDFVPVFPEARDDGTDACNRRGHLLWWRHARAGHPVVLCVHGYGGGQPWIETLGFQALRFYRAGIDVVLYVLPYHGVRTPPGARHSGEPFFDMDLVRTNEAFARAIYELRTLVHRLPAMGTGPVGAFGMSLGGYTAALLASVEPALAFVAAMIPVVSFADRWWSVEDDPWLAVATQNGWSRAGVESLLRVHEPIARPALVPHDRRLVIGARADGICTPQHAERLWRHWDRPRIHWYPGGHLMQLRRTAALRDVRALVRDAGLLPRR